MSGLSITERWLVGTYLAIALVRQVARDLRTIWRVTTP